MLYPIRISLWEVFWNWSNIYRSYRSQFSSSLRCLSFIYLEYL